MTTYTIKSGDTLSKIAAQYGTTVAALASTNGISNPNKISAGATLTIPTTSSSSGPSFASLSSPTGGTSSGTNIVQFNPATGARLSPGQSVTYNGQTYTQGQPAPTSTGNASAGPYSYVPNADGTYDIYSTAHGGAPVLIGTSTTNSSTGVFTPNTGDATSDAIVSGAQKITAQELAAGNTVNPNLTITPALTAQFLAEAQAQADPEFQQALTSNIDQINNSLANLTTQYNNSVATSQLNYQQNLLAERNAAAGEGQGVSGARNLVEQQMQNGENLSLSSLAANTQNQIGGVLAQGGNLLGQGITGLNGNQSNMNVPTLFGASVSNTGLGGAGPSGNALNYNYNPSTYTLGSLNQSFNADVANNQGALTSNYLGTAVNNAPAVNVPSFQDLSNTS